MDTVVDTKRRRKHLDEALCLIGCPAVLHLAIFAELRLLQVAGRVDAHRFESVRAQAEDGRAVHIALTRREHRLDVGHDGLQVLAFMQEHAVPLADLVFPILLPLRERRLLQQAVSLDDQLRSSGLEAHATLDADDGIADVTVAADGIARANLFNLLDGFHLVAESFAVDCRNLTLVEGDLQQRFWLLGGDVFQVSLFRESLRGVEKLAAADARSPDAYVVGVLQLGKVGRKAVLVQIVHLFLTRQLLIACQCDDLHSRRHHEERHVEANLVVAGAR